MNEDEAVRRPETDLGEGNADPNLSEDWRRGMPAAALDADDGWDDELPAVLP